MEFRKFNKKKNYNKTIKPHGFTGKELGYNITSDEQNRNRLREG